MTDTTCSAIDILARLKARQKRCKGARNQEVWALMRDAIHEIERLRARNTASCEEHQDDKLHAC